MMFCKTEGIIQHHDSGGAGGLWAYFTVRTSVMPGRSIYLSKFMASQGFIRISFYWPSIFLKSRKFIHVCEH